MGYIAALIAFNFIYYTMYLGPTALVIFIFNSYFANQILPEDASNLITILLYLILLIMIAFSAYRARIAAKCFDDNNMKFLEAHNASWGISKSTLSFLPLIGRLFHDK